MRPVRVLFMGFLPPPDSGTQLSSLDVLRGLVRLGHTVDALACTREGTAWPDPRAGLRPSLRVRRFVRAPADSQLYEPQPRALFRLWRGQVLNGLRPLLAEARPDVVLVGHESLAPGVTALARAHRVPCVAHARGSLVNALLDGR